MSVIAAIYGLERSGAATALVMELVEGPTLADRISQGAIPLDEALPIAKQIAEALEAAHEQGIIHRDLKPANIKVRPDGTVKVLDFGLAKAMEPSGAMSSSMSMSPTITSPAMMTGVGMILGTAAYMSPEQARGKAIDRRSDVWAFGCVFYEMLTGRRVFEGDEMTDVLARVIEREPNFGVLPAATPAPIRKLLRRALEKDRKRRLADAADARLEIEEALAPAVIEPSAAAPARRRERLAWTTAAVLAASLALAVGVIAAAWFRLPSPIAPLTWTGTLLSGPNVAWVPRISPDGRTLAFLAFVDGLTQVGVMNPQSGNWSVLTRDRSRGYVSRISWSRDGSRIYYNRYTDVPLGIYSVPALGGEERLILENANGAEPLADGSLLVAKINGDRQMQIYHYWPADGRLTALPVFCGIPKGPHSECFRMVRVRCSGDGHPNNRLRIGCRICICSISRPVRPLGSPLSAMVRAQRTRWPSHPMVVPSS